MYMWILEIFSYFCHLETKPNLMEDLLSILEF